MTLTVKDVTLADMLQADIDNTLVKKMSFPYNNVTEVVDAVMELEGVIFSICNQFENSEEYFIVNTTYGKLKLNRKYFHSVIIE